MIKRYLLILLLSVLTNHVFTQQAPLVRPDVHLGDHNDLLQLQKALQKLYPQLNNPHSSLELLNRIESLAAIHYSFRQKYRGIPIYQKGIKASLDKQGKIRSISGSLAKIPEQKTPKMPHFSLPIQGIKKSIAETYAAYEVLVEPMLYLDQGEFLPVYRLTGYSHGPVYSFEVLLNAQTRHEISWNSLDLHLRPASSGDTTANARIFNPNPCTKAQVNYGELFIDSLDFHKIIFETLMDTIILQGICIESDSFRLKGPYVEIKNLEGPSIKPVASADGNFFFGRDEYGFEQVMAYYHIDNFQRKIRAFGFQNLSDGAVYVDAQGTFSDNSVTSIKDSVPSLLFGLGGVDDAEDADVIIHEYGHALSYYATKQSAADGNIERLGLEEGIGDYLAAIYSQDQGFENWHMLFNWDGHNEFWPGRVANSPATYPPNDTTIYTLGTIWASTLMDLRGLLGKNIVDSLFFEELYMNSPSTNLTDAAQLFLLADSLLFEGSHSEEISFTFCERGLLPSLSGDCAVVSTQPLLLAPNLSIFPNPTEGILTLKLENTQAQFDCTLYNNLGQQVFAKKVLSGHNRLDLEFLPAGVYVVRILENRKLVAAKKLVIAPKK